MEKYLLMTLIFVLGSVAPAQHDHHAEQSSSALQLDNGKKWPIDAPMIKNMELIKNQFNQMSHSKPNYLGLSKVIKSATADIIKNCKLSPKADAAFHVLLADLLLAADELRLQKSAAKGVERIRAVLLKYPKYFEHPGWS